jgi:hypothetical protein
MLTVPVLLLLAGAVILVGVVSVAMGRGGEMAEFASDYLPPTLDEVVTAADVALLRPPSAVWGYNVQATDEALSRIAQVVTERDVEIAVLRQQLADLRSAAGGQQVSSAERAPGRTPTSPLAAGKTVAGRAGTGQPADDPASNENGVADAAVADGVVTGQPGHGQPGAQAGHAEPDRAGRGPAEPDVGLEEEPARPHTVGLNSAGAEDLLPERTSASRDD